MKKIIAFYPYTNPEMTYINSVQSMIQSKYYVASYQDVKNGLFDLKDVGVLYLNWIEGNSDLEDKKFLERSKSLGVKIVWVFHNKIPHDINDISGAIEWIKFYINISDKICILSRDSISVIKKYCPDADVSKIHYLPHQDYINMYGYLNKPNGIVNNSDKYMVYGCFGQIRPYKNIELLIEAFNCFKYRDNSKLIIAGRPINIEYVETLKKMSRHDNIIFDSEYIPSAMLGRYIEQSDILVLPYNVESSMNSGAMVMSFSYERTVIVPKIEMVSEFPQDKLFSYYYSNRGEHLECLLKQMERAYELGKEELHNKGRELKQFLISNNSKEIVMDNILSLFEELIDKKDIDNDYSAIKNVIYEREFWKEQCKLQNVKFQIEKANTSVSEILRNLGIREIAIYGYGGEGIKLYNELKESGIVISYIIDRRGNEIKAEVPVYTPDDRIPFANYVLVTSSQIDVHAFMRKQREYVCCIMLKELY